MAEIEKEVRPYSFLFADYGVELAKHWSKIQGYRYRMTTGEEVTDSEKLKVVYGQPNSAFRRLFFPDNQNDQVSMPVLNIYISDARRIKERQNPYASWTQYDGFDGSLRHRAGQVYELTWSCSLWTDTNKSRDDIMSQIIRDFNTSLNLKHYYNDGSENYMWMTWSAPDSFQDNTDLESLPEKSTVKFRRMDFNLLGEAVVPLESRWYKAIKEIQVNTTVKDYIDVEDNSKYKLKLLPTSTPEDISFEISRNYFENI